MPILSFKGKTAVETYHHTVPLEAGNRKRVVVKIIDDRGIGSLKIVEVG